MWKLYFDFAMFIVSIVVLVTALIVLGPQGFVEEWAREIAFIKTSIF